MTCRARSSSSRHQLSCAPVTSNGYVTYGVLTSASRLSDAALDVWARILRSDATSRLLIKDYLISDLSIQTRLLENFAARGIAPERICLMGSTSREEHLAAYRRIDICLDPFPPRAGASLLGKPCTWDAGRVPDGLSYSPSL